MEQVTRGLAKLGDLLILPPLRRNLNDVVIHKEIPPRPTHVFIVQLLIADPWVYIIDLSLRGTLRGTIYAGIRGRSSSGSGGGGGGSGDASVGVSSVCY